MGGGELVKTQVAKLCPWSFRFSRNWLGVGYDHTLRLPPPRQLGAATPKTLNHRNFPASIGTLDKRQGGQTSFSYWWGGRLHCRLTGLVQPPSESLHYLKERIRSSQGRPKETGRCPESSSEEAGRTQSLRASIFFLPTSHQSKCTERLLLSRWNVFSGYRKHLGCAPQIRVFIFQEQKCDFEVTGE